MTATSKKIVRIGGYYFVHDRFGLGPNDRIIRISGLGEELPQRIEGLVINIHSGKQIYTVGADPRHNPSDYYVYACEIGKEVPLEELTKLKEKLTKNITDFFETPTERFLSQCVSPERRTPCH